MNNLKEYITEKFKISKDIKTLSTPENLDDLKTLFKEYFWEWAANREIFPPSKNADINMMYNSIKYYFEHPRYNFTEFVRTVLPVNFRKYLNKKYDLSIDEKL